MNGDIAPLHEQFPGLSPDSVACIGSWRRLLDSLQSVVSRREEEEGGSERGKKEEEGGRRREGKG
jgi:hypothetical protein